MSVEIICRYVGEKKTELIHGPSGAKIITVPPVDNQGDGSSFSPTDLSAASLCSCMITTMVLYADRKGIDLKGTHARIEKHMISDPRRIGKLPVWIHMPKALTQEQREVLKNVALTCPVAKSINPQIELPVEFAFDI